jgi:hypothetical protein
MHYTVIEMGRVLLMCILGIFFLFTLECTNVKQLGIPAPSHDNGAHEFK